MNTTKVAGVNTRGVFTKTKKGIEMDYKKKLSKLLKKTQAELWEKYGNLADEDGTLIVNKSEKYSETKMFISKNDISILGKGFANIHYMWGVEDTMLTQSDILTSGLYTPEDWYDWAKKTIREIVSDIFVG